MNLSINLSSIFTMAYFKVQKMKRNERYYPVAVLTDRPMETDEIAQQISEASTVSKADVVAVLAALPTVMARGMDAGRSVHLQDIGRFRYTIATKKGGQATAKEVSANDVDHTRVHFTPEGSRRQAGVVTRALSDSAHWVKWTGTTDASTSEGGGAEQGGGEGQEESPL